MNDELIEQVRKMARDSGIPFVGTSHDEPDIDAVKQAQAVNKIIIPLAIIGGIIVTAFMYLR